jgi:GNAT superfamily N-acetyltransferase
MTDKVTIRRVEESDIPKMTAARIDYLAEMQGDRPEQYKEELQQNLQLYFQNSIREQRFFALQAEIEEIVVSYGAMILKKIPGDFNQSSYLEGEILNMYTPPEYRRKGYSSLILENLLKEAGKMGVSKVSLHCSRAGEPLYRKFGFSDPQYPYLELIIGE